MKDESSSHLSFRRLAFPKPIQNWSLTTLREKLVKIGAKVTGHARVVIMARIAGLGRLQAQPKWEISVYTAVLMRFAIPFL